MNYCKKCVNKAELILISIILLTGLSSASLNTDISSPFNEVLCAIFLAIRYLSLPLAALIIIAAAAIWVESRDDAGKRNAAKVWIIHAIIGLIILLIAVNVITSVKVSGSSTTINC
jgi:hypothetical protein